MKKSLQRNEPRGLLLVVRAQHVMCGLEACHGSEICCSQKHGIYVKKDKEVDHYLPSFESCTTEPRFLCLKKQEFFKEMMKKHMWDVEAGQQRYLEMPLFMIILERSIIILLMEKLQTF